MTAPTIQSIRTLEVSLRAAPELVVHGAAGTHDQSQFLLVQVTTSTGEVGYGEVSATPLWSGEDAVTARHFIAEVFAPALVGAQISPISALEAVMDRLVAGNQFTKAGVSTALWDVYARHRNVTLAEALGGVVRNEIPIKCSLSGTPE